MIIPIADLSNQELERLLNSYKAKIFQLKMKETFLIKEKQRRCFHKNIRPFGYINFCDDCGCDTSKE